MPRSPYSSLHERLVANTHEPDNEQSCWVWSGKLDRSSYGRVNVYVPSESRVVILMAHIAMWVVHKYSVRSANELYRRYQMWVREGLELDHLCRMPSCIRPDHLEPVTPAVNCQRRDSRLRNR